MNSLTGSYATKTYDLLNLDAVRDSLSKPLNSAYNSCEDRIKTSTFSRQPENQKAFNPESPYKISKQSTIERSFDNSRQNESKLSFKHHNESQFHNRSHNTNHASQFHNRSNNTNRASLPDLHRSIRKYNVLTNSYLDTLNEESQLKYSQCDQSTLEDQRKPSAVKIQRPFASKLPSLSNFGGYLARLNRAGVQEDFFKKLTEPVDGTSNTYKNNERIKKKTNLLS